tara:strand:- start:45 stop:293 length:249 start_codon:yes stop_codon:yes gene_type:complete
MLYADFVNPDDPSKGVAIYWDKDKSPDDKVQQDSPLVVADWDEWHRLIMEIQSLRDQRDVSLRRASLRLVSDLEKEYGHVAP